MKSAKKQEIEILKTTIVSKDVKTISDLLLTPEQLQFMNAYISNGLKIQKASRICKLKKNIFYDWKANYPHFAKAIELCKDKLLDDLEDAFKDLIEERNPAAVMFGLRTLGRNRGYAEKQDVNVTGITGIKVIFDNQLNIEDNENE